MRVVIQRVSEASVKIDGEVKGEIQQGLMVLVGVEGADNEADVDWIATKVINQRIFSDKEGKMNLSVKDVGGNVLLISQFTLHASTKKGNRPSFINAAKSPMAIPLYQALISKLSVLLARNIETGEFGADMKVSLINDGPVTIVMDSKSKE